jgi:TolB-like protein
VLQDDERFVKARRVNAKNIFTELKRRNVYRAAVAYGVVAWFLTQLTTQVFPFFEIPNSAVRFVVIALAVGFPIAMLLAWVYEFTPEGVVRTEDLDPLQARSARRATGRIFDFIIIGALLLVIAMLIVGRRPFYRKTGESIPQKSIAVLPLENLSGEKENAYFADGIQDELLASLSKVKELKVISRTSVMQYKAGITRTLKEIAQKLGVNHVVEGSVRRSGGHVRVSVQLIDAQTDRHIWVQNYDRTLADSLTLQGELATEIAAAVGATLSPQEKAQVTAKPTNNVAAYDAYLHGRVFASEENDLEKALNSYRKAVELDPNFALAWTRLSSMQSQAYWQVDSSPARLTVAKTAVNRALALDPSLPEVHLALAYYRYYVERDFTGALAELRQAEQALPNDTDVVKTIAFIQRRQGQWDKALAGLCRTVELDPRDIEGYSNLALTYEALRRFPEALATFDRASTWEPANFDCNCAWKSLGRMRADALLSMGNFQDFSSPGHGSVYSVAFIRAGQALLQARYADAKDILSKALADESMSRNQNSPVLDEWEILLLPLGLAQQRSGDIAAARATYQQVVRDARHALETVPPGSHAEAEAHANLGWAYAALGEPESAIAEGRKAMTLIPSSKDAYIGPTYEQNMARIYALLGDADQAIPILDRLLRIPYLASLTPAKLRIDPTFEQIRNDPRFQKLAAEKKL